MTLLFRALKDDFNTTSLPSTVTLNSIAVAPVALYKGQDASLSTWTATFGNNLASASSGTDPTFQHYTPMNEVDKAVQLNGGEVYQAADTSFADVGTQDMMLELILRLPSTVSGTGTILGKFPSSGARWRLRMDGSGNLLFTLVAANTAAGTATVTTSGMLGSWVVVHAFNDFSDTANTGLRMYVNGVSVGVTTKGTPDTYTNSGALTIGATSALAEKITDAQIAYAAVYRQASWFAGGSTNSTEWLAFAAERSARIFGTYATTASGSAVPTTASRGSIAYLDRVIDEATGERRLFLVGNDWMRRCKRKELSGGEFLGGNLIEFSRTNLCLQSQTFDNASWTKTATTVTANSLAAPNGGTEAESLVATAAGTDHSLSQSITLTAVAHTFSVFAKKGTSDYIGLFANAVSNGIMFNLNTGTVGNRYAASASITGTIEAFGNGWYRCSATYTGTAAASSHFIQLSQADWSANSSNTHLFTGDGTSVLTYIWGAQVEAVGFTTSYIPTTTASVARSTDVLRYSSTSNVSSDLSGTIVVKFLMRNLTFGSFRSVLSISDNSGTNYIEFDLSSDTLDVFGSGGLSIDTATDRTDGEIHEGRLLVATNNTRLYVDTVLAATDVSHTLPSSLTRIEAGSLLGATQLEGLISDIRIYDTENLNDGTTTAGTLAITEANDSVVIIGYQNFEQQLLILPGRWLTITPATPLLSLRKEWSQGGIILLVPE